VLSDAAVLKRQAKEIEELRRKLGNAGCAFGVELSDVRCDTTLSRPLRWAPMMTTLAQVTDCSPPALQVILCVSGTAFCFFRW